MSMVAEVRLASPMAGPAAAELVGVQRGDERVGGDAMDSAALPLSGVNDIEVGHKLDV